MLSKGDDYPVHQTPDPIAYAGSDRNFYDRYFFNGYTGDGEVFFAAALGVYPHLGIMDAAFAVRIGERQYNLRASRHLGGERMDTQVGPIRVEVVEPLQRLRIVVDDPEHGIGADLLFEGRSPPIEEPRAIRRNGPRVLQDFTRMTQLGRYSGSLRAGGRTIALDGRQVEGVRDRSWGVRPVGERDPQPQVPAPEAQFHWIWIPVNLGDRGLLFYLNEDRDGIGWNLGLTIAHDDGRVEHLPGAAIETAFEPGSRWPRVATIRAAGQGGEHRITVTAGARFYMTGIGYMDPDWSHGINKGPLAIGYDEFGPAEHPLYAPPFIYAQSFATVTAIDPDGTAREGRGSFELLSFGPHARHGFVAMHDAP